MVRGGATALRFDGADTVGTVGVSLTFPTLFGAL